MSRVRERFALVYQLGQVPVDEDFVMPICGGRISLEVPTTIVALRPPVRTQRLGIPEPRLIA